MELRSFKRYAAERIYFTGQTAIDQRDAYLSRASIESHIEHERNLLVLQMRSHVHGMTRERITVNERWPTDWWQAFKERWLPKWALDRWPVQYREIHIDQPIYLAVCPHIQDQPQGTHLQWMAAEYEKAGEI